jgi:DNA-binding response OmpR family regulator
MANVLLLEPDNLLGQIYQQSLSKKHYVVHCKMAETAISELDNNRIDLVILELQIALHNGMEFLYEIRSYPEWQNIPVMLLTHVAPKTLEQCSTLHTQLNITACLYKPTTTLATLRELVDQHTAYVNA